MNIPAIPLYLLIHNIVIQESSETSSSSLKRPGKLIEHEFDRVRIEPKDKASITPTGVNNIPQNKGEFTLFIDSVNSINKDDYLLKIGDKVIWNGISRVAVSNYPVYSTDTNKPHHWEVELE
ncbi:putative minor capsid protein [Companilactobacillus allii]|uniref:Minor capsid protein n=1 Tax=Companilactobacillus allii TaxID=1847728 RepID=A0A1P8Q4S6_9LACO|nr:putative minor capsid protein [Companilactobacillus allii]APX72866.1 hypothetical protein BTM29_10025 [Companilactobacillus allii]USQ67654.1 putative minor capsid protein [Companilactobacillus allii]